MKTTRGLNTPSAIPSAVRSRPGNHLLPALVAVGGVCGLAVNPASALELGEIAVDSSLGQPLRASIAYALQPHESIADYCIFVKPVNAARGLPGIGNSGIAVTGDRIILRGQSAVREPMLALQLSVECPNVAKLAREYTLLIDPAMPQDDVRFARQADPVRAAPTALQSVAPGKAFAQATRADIVSEAAPVERAAARRAVRSAPAGSQSTIGSGERYRVQPGDTLSQIVSRIDGRTVGMWPAVDAIFVANPSAFLNNDRDLLRAGAILDIPDLGSAFPVLASVTQPETAPVAIAATVPPVVEASPAFESPSTEIQPISSEAAATIPVIAPEQPVAAIDIAPVTRNAPVIAIPDTSIAVTENVPSIQVFTDSSASETKSWLRWLAGAGLTVLLSLLIFGRQIRDRFGSVAITKPVVAQRRNKRIVNASPGATFANQAPVVPEKIEEPQPAVPAVEDETPVHMEFAMPLKPVRDDIVIQEIPPTDTEREDDYILAVTAELPQWFIEDEDATAKDLQVLARKQKDHGNLSIVKDFERQVFEKDYEAAMIATGQFAKAFGEANDEIDTDGETVEFKTSNKAS